MAFESEKPFGNLYTASDYNFFAAMNDKIKMRRTPAEDAETSFALREIYADISSDNNSKMARLINQIEREDGLEVKFSEGESVDRLFVLTQVPIEFAVIQGQRRTRVLFQPNPYMRYDPYYFYDLFFDQIPKALYGTGRDAPTQEHIRESTIAAVLKKGIEEPFQFDLQRPSEKEEFEKIMDNQGEVDSVKLICDGLGVSYSVILPNPKNPNNDYVHFSFPSMIPLPQDAVGLLLNIHSDGWKLNGENKGYSKSFTSAINKIREELRTR